MRKILLVISFTSGTSVCNGDSGGSMTFEKDGIYSIRGIVSFTKVRRNSNLCDPNEYVLFTDVAQYLTWIEEHVPELNRPQHADDSGKNFSALLLSTFIISIFN